MTRFPPIDLPPQPSRRMNELLEQTSGLSAKLSGDEFELITNEGKFDLLYAQGHRPFFKLWLESMKYFLHRKKGDWGVLFQLGIRDLENYWRDQNTQEVFEISQEHLDFESAWQAQMAKELAVCLCDFRSVQDFQTFDYPQKIKFWEEFIQVLNTKLSPYLELELISYEKKEVLQKEEEKGIKADRVVFSLSWLTQGLTWTDSAKKRWIKNFMGSVEELSCSKTATPVKWVAEGGQFP